MEGAVPIEKTVVLVGAGNAHLVFVNRWAMRPDPRIAVTLISEAPVIPYSAMVPAYIAGDYARDEITIDLVRLCSARKVRFVAGRVTAIDPATRQVQFNDRPPLSYDVLSLGVGSLPACPEHCLDDEPSLPMRPLGRMVTRLEKFDLRHLVVVGGGASGCELALAIRRRYANLRVTLLQGSDRLLPRHPPGVSKRFEQALRDAGIDFRLNARVSDFRDGRVSVEGSDSVAADLVLWATQAAPTPLLRHSGLPVDAGGFLRVTETLQSVGDPAVFGTGDCVAFEAYPDLPRNGVHAVREGAVLFDNILAFLYERPQRPFRPQRFTLALFNTADGEAVLSYGPLSFKSRWARRFKERIDRRWMKMFEATPMAEDRGGQPGSSPAELMRCGGCGSKISGDVLSAVLKRLDLPDDPRLVLGVRAGEDAAAHRVKPELYGDRDGLVEVQTVDYFKAFIDDPFLFGRIAAQHAVSDLYAMNARPFSALAIATLPYARGPVQEAQLYELLAGAVATFREQAVVLSGGHTTEGHELALGFAVTGFGEEARLFRKSGLKPGDNLILTKPLGTGALLAAWMRGRCRAEWFTAAIESMLKSNRAAAEVLRDAGVSACTDVTGFGLAGHLLEMLDASRVAARLDAAAVSLLPGFVEVVKEGIVSTLQRDNAKVACRVSGTAPEWLFDPQTSGGLLAGVCRDAANEVLRRLRDAGCADAAIIGEVVAPSDGPPLAAYFTS
jgi:selenide,water dikinase